MVVAQILRPDPVPTCAFVDDPEANIPQRCHAPAVGEGCEGPACAEHMCSHRCPMRRLYVPAGEMPAIDEGAHLTSCECALCQLARRCEAAPEVARPSEVPAIKDEPAVVYAAEAAKRIWEGDWGGADCALDQDETEGELGRAYRAGQHRGQEDMRADRARLCDEAYEAGRADGQREEKVRVLILLEEALDGARRKRVRKALKRLRRAVEGRGP